MIDIREHGGSYGGGLSKSKPIEVDETNLTSTDALVSIMPSFSGYQQITVVGADESFVYAYSNNGFFILDKMSGALAQTITFVSISTSTTFDMEIGAISKWVFDSETKTLYFAFNRSGEPSIFIGRFNYIDKIAHRNQSYLTSQSNYLIALTNDSVFFVAIYGGMLFFEKGFTKISTPTRTITYGASINLISATFDEQNNKIFLSLNTNYIRIVDLITGTYTDTTGSTLLGNGVTVYFDEDFTVIYEVNGVTLRKLSLNGQALSVIYTTTLPKSVYGTTKIYNLSSTKLWIGFLGGLISVSKPDGIAKGAFVDNSYAPAFGSGYFDDENKNLVFSIASFAGTSIYYILNVNSTFKLL